MRLFRLLVFLPTILAIPFEQEKRGSLNNVFDPFQPGQQVQETHIEHAGDHLTTIATHQPQPNTISLPGLISSLESAKTKESSTSHSASSTSLASTSHSTTSTSSPLLTPVPTPTQPASATQPSFTAPPTQSPSPSKNQSLSHGSGEWKIIGVAVISFSAVAAILLLSVFFDQWWGFLRDLVWRKKRKDHVEEFIPDWEKASWELRLGADRHRYPAMTPATKSGTPPSDRTCCADAERGGGAGPGVEYMTGVGSGFANNTNNNMLYAPQPTHNHWAGLGIMTPITPVPPARCADQTLARSTSLSRNKSRMQPSPALSDPYGGIE